MTFKGHFEHVKIRERYLSSLSILAASETEYFHAWVSCMTQVTADKKKKPPPPHKTKKLWGGGVVWLVFLTCSSALAMVSIPGQILDEEFN